VLHQVFEDPVFAWLQVDGLAAALDAVGQTIQLQVGYFQLAVVRLHVTAPQQHLDARQQLGKGKGLDQVVVATGPQALHPVVHLAQGAEDDHRRLPAGTAQGLEDRQAIEGGQHAVEDDDVVVVLQCHEQAILAIAGLIGRVAVLFEPLGNEVGSVDVVFDDENAHGVSLAVPELFYSSLN